MYVVIAAQRTQRGMWDVHGTYCPQLSPRNKHLASANILHCVDGVSNDVRETTCG